MVWLLIIGSIAVVCLLAFRPDVVAAFWATVTIVCFAFLMREMFDEWFGRERQDRRRGPGRRKEDRTWSRINYKSYNHPS
ncbi:MAG: hypothetical protein ACE5NW_06485 [Acidiferrobacterales bacterium]